MKHWGWRRWLIVPVWLFWTGAAVAEPAAVATKRPFLWKVQSDRGTAYLFGSLHAARPEMYPLDERIYRAFDDSDKLVLEADISGEKVFGMAGQMLAKAMYPAGDSAEKHLSPATFEQLQARCAKLGLPAAQFKPWFLAMMLEALALESAGMGMQHGMELHFLARGQGRKPILELEGANAQIDMLESLTDKEQDLFLKHTLESVDKLGEALEQMLAAWNAGDDQQLDKFLRESLKEVPDFASIYKKLFDDRNEKMAVKVEEYLNAGGTYFVVVGAGHLVGETGLLQVLGKKYQVTRP